ncbi:hypothetical protein GCM10009799_20410 [Nocardiopsis rhodophaea]|uniref:DNA primase/polymerase bifunctional N-terminal domain-containing protein n=1 Tax=Nocardiopsis rhodophaea TaxID=280238 RepID=A0ABN2SXU5_9ACTN
MSLTVPDINPDAGTIAAALAYAECGWYVLPVDPGTKHPGSVVGKGWPAKSSRDPEVIADWFLLDGHALALHVGRSGGIVFDVDRPDAAPQALTDAAKQHVAPFQSTREDAPGRGHYVFAAPPGRTLGNGAGRLGRDWGEVRGRNGIIIVEPSVHAKASEGGRYAWTRTGPVPTLPDQVAELLPDATESADAATDTEVARFLDAHTSAERPGLLRALVSRFTADIAAGRSRHESMLLPCVNAMREARAGMYPAMDAAEALRAVFVHTMTRPHDGSSRTLTPAAAETEYAGILAWAIGQATDATPDELDAVAQGADERAPDPATAISDLIPPPTSNGTGAEGTLATVHPLTPDQHADAEEARRLAHERRVAEEVERLEVREEARRRVRARQRPTDAPHLVALDEFLSVDDPPQRYRLHDLWPLGGRVMLAAQFKAGKTTLVGNLLRSLTDGDAFLGRFGVEPLADGRRVVVIDDELDERMIRAWLRDQNITRTGRAAVLSLRGKLASFDILDPHTRSRWADALRDAGAEVVVLDCLAPLLDALGLSEDKEAGQLLVAFDELLDEAGVSEAVVVHHMGHSGERTRGASRLRDWPDVEWRLVREKGDDGETDPAAPRYFSAYGRDVEIPESALTFDPENRRLTLSGGSRAGVRLRGAREAIVELLTARPGLSGRAIEVELADEFKQKDIRSALKGAVSEGQIHTAPGPRRSTLHSVNQHWPNETHGVLPAKTQCVSASGEIGLEQSSANPVRHTPNALKPQVTQPVRQCVTSASTQSEASASVRPPKGGTHTDALTRPDPRPADAPNPEPAPLGHANRADRIVVIDGRILTLDGAILTRHGDELVDTTTGEVRGHVSDLPEGA